MSFTRYTVVGSLARIGASESLFLNQPQASARAHALTDEGKGVFTATQPLDFKAGEVIGLTVKPESLPRYLSDILRVSTKEEIAASEKAHRHAVKAQEQADAKGASRVTKDQDSRRAKVNAGKARDAADKRSAAEKAKDAAAAEDAEKRRAEEEAAKIAAGGQ